MTHICYRYPLPPRCRHGPALAEPLAGPSLEPHFLLPAAPLTRAANFSWQFSLSFVALGGRVAPRALTSSISPIPSLCQLITTLLLQPRGSLSG